jgi:hypothetical protein
VASLIQEDGTRAADWSCLGQPLPPPPLNFPARVTYTFPLVEWVTDVPLPGRTVTVCNRIDSACMTPLNAPSTIVDGVADVSVQIPAGQNVYLILTSPGTIPSVLYLDGPMYEDQRGGKIQLLTPETAVGLATQVQIPLDFMQGMLAIRPHALYTINDGSGRSIPYSFVNGLPRAESPALPSVNTTIPSDNTPWAGFVNVPPGGLTVNGILAEGGREFGTADIQVRPQFINNLEIRALNRL